MTHMDCVSAFELGDPVAVFIRAEYDYAARRGVGRHHRDVVA